MILCAGIMVAYGWGRLKRKSAGLVPLLTTTIFSPGLGTAASHTAARVSPLESFRYAHVGLHPGHFAGFVLASLQRRSISGAGSGNP